MDMESQNLMFSRTMMLFSGVGSIAHNRVMRKYYFQLINCISWFFFILKVDIKATCTCDVIFFQNVLHNLLGYKSCGTSHCSKKTSTHDLW